MSKHFVLSEKQLVPLDIKRTKIVTYERDFINLDWGFVRITHYILSTGEIKQFIASTPEENKLRMPSRLRKAVSVGLIPEIVMLQWNAWGSNLMNRLQPEKNHLPIETIKYKIYRLGQVYRILAGTTRFIEFWDEMIQVYGTSRLKTKKGS